MVKMDRNPSWDSSERSERVYNSLLEVLLEETDCPEWQWCLYRKRVLKENPEIGHNLRSYCVGYFVRFKSVKIVHHDAGLKIITQHKDLEYDPENPAGSLLKNMVQDYDDEYRYLDNRWYKREAQERLRLLFTAIYGTMKALHAEYPDAYPLPEEEIIFQKV